MFSRTKWRNFILHFFSSTLTSYFQQFCIIIFCLIVACFLNCTFSVIATWKMCFRTLWLCAKLLAILLAELEIEISSDILCISQEID